MAMAAVNRCVTLISGAVASMPLRYLKGNADGTRLPYTASPLYKLLRFRPNADNTAFEFVRTMVRLMLCDGAVFIYPEHDPVSDEITALRLVRQCYVTCYRQGGYYAINDPEQRLCAPCVLEERIIFLRGLSPDGYHGESTTALTQGTADIAAAADNEARERISNGGNTRFFVQSDEGMMGTGAAVEGAIQRMLDRLGDQLQNKSQNAIYLPDGMKATPAGATAADMQFQSMREFAVREVCRFFGVPPTFVFCDGAANYKTTEAAQLDFMQNTLDPLLRNIEAEFSSKLIKASRWGVDTIEFDRQSRHAADLDSRSRYYTSMLGVGITPNEIRRMENLPPVEGGDTACISANLRPLGAEAAGATNTATNTNNKNTD